MDIHIREIKVDAAVAALTTEQLIERLQQETMETFQRKSGRSALRAPALDQGFAPVNAPKLDYRPPSQAETRSPVMIELIRRGPSALPPLLEHLTDNRPTGCYVGNPRHATNGSPLGFADQYVA